MKGPAALLVDDWNWTNTETLSSNLWQNTYIKLNTHVRVCVDVCGYGIGKRGAWLHSVLTGPCLFKMTKKYLACVTNYFEIRCKASTRISSA